MNKQNDNTEISLEALEKLGVNTTIYIKPVVVDGVTAFAVHNAAGMAIGIMPSEIHARAAAIEHDLQIASIH